MTLTASMLEHVQQPEVTGDALAAYESEIDRLRQTLIAYSIELQERMPRFALSAPDCVQSAASQFIGRSRGIAMSGRSHREIGQEIALFGGPVADYFAASGRRRLRRRHRLRRYLELLGELSTGQDIPASSEPAQ